MSSAAVDIHMCLLDRNFLYGTYVGKELFCHSGCIFFSLLHNGFVVVVVVSGLELRAYTLSHATSPFL
jgi:hypothetical protein